MRTSDERNSNMLKINNRGDAGLNLGAFLLFFRLFVPLHETMDEMAIFSDKTSKRDQLHQQRDFVKLYDSFLKKKTVAKLTTRTGNPPVTTGGSPVVTGGRRS